jgi:hypothetical protein
VIVQMKAADKAGKPVHLVYRHRWVQKDGTWYFRPPTVVTTHTPAAAPAGRVGRGRRP